MSDCETQLGSIQLHLDGIKKGVKVAEITLPILGGVLIIGLFLVIILLVKLVFKIKRMLPIPKDWGFIRFIRNLDKLELKINDKESIEADIKLEKGELKLNEKELDIKISKKRKR